jgi:hypothetical protein
MRPDHWFFLLYLVRRVSMNYHHKLAILIRAREFVFLLHLLSVAEIALTGHKRLFGTQANAAL